MEVRGIAAQVWTFRGIVTPRERACPWWKREAREFMQKGAETDGVKKIISCVR